MVKSLYALAHHKHRQTADCWQMNGAQAYK
jgi:hypothetical protein